MMNQLDNVYHVEFKEENGRPKAILTELKGLKGFYKTVYSWSPWENICKCHHRCCVCHISVKKIPFMLLLFNLKFANKVCCFIWLIKAVQNIESISIISYNCTSAKF